MTLFWVSQSSVVVHSGLWWRSYGIVGYHTRIKTRQCKVCYLICSAFVKTILFLFFEPLFKTCSIAVFLFSKVLPKISSPTRPQPHLYFEIIKTIICPRPNGGSTVWPDIVCGLPTKKFSLFIIIWRIAQSSRLYWKLQVIPQHLAKQKFSGSLL